MKKSIALKTLLRSPLKTMLTFLLIAAASFALFSRVTDYAVTTRETRNAESLYHAVASLDNEVPDVYMDIPVSSPNGWSMAGYGFTYEMEDKPWPTGEELAEFSSLPGVTLADTRYMTAGRVEDYKRMTGDGDSGGIAVIEGTYTGYESNESILEDHICLKFEDVKVIASEEGPEIGSTITLEPTPFGEMYYAKSPYTRAFYDSLEEGSRCLVLVNNTGVIGSETGIMFSYDVGEGALRVLDGQPDNYLETASFARQKGWVEAINHNNYTYDIVYTSDMRAIPDFNKQRRIISEGSILTAENKNGCVVSQEFLKEHNLSIGDSISVQLGKTLCRGSGQVIEGKEVPEFADPTELAIVGAYAGGEGDSMFSYPFNTIYVNSDLLPVEIPDNYEPIPSNFSVFVENARDIESFYEAASQFAEKMDLKLEFSDRGWLDVKDSLNMGAFTSLLTTLLYIAGAALSLFLAAYLYIGRSKETYAIMRTLGVPSGPAGNSIALPFAAVLLLAAPIGGVAGLHYAMNTVKEALLGMADSAPSGYVLNTELPVSVIVLCLLSELLFVSLTVYFFLWKMKKTSPLELLQENAKLGTKAGSRKNPLESSPTESLPVKYDIAKLSAVENWMTPRNYGPVRHVAAYILRHMRRGIGRTAVSLILAVVLAAGMGTLVLARIAYQDAFHELRVKGEAEDFIFSYAVELSTSSLIKDFYCEDSFGVRVKGTELDIPMKVTSDIARNLGDDYTVDYAEGFDLSSFEGTAQVCLAGEELAEKLGISPGDEIGMLSPLLYSMLLREGGKEMVEKGYKTYKVIGVIQSDDESVKSGIFTGIRSDLTRIFSIDFSVDYCEFTLADNKRLDELDELLAKRKIGSERYSPKVTYYLDSGGLANIERVRGLLEALFPIAVAAALLIGVFGPLLIIIQSAQEAAFLRILGVTKKRVRCILVFEQIILCLAGILLVTGGLVLYNSDQFVRSIETLRACFALYFLGCACGAFAAAVQVTRHKVLVLLQVRE